jgi:hypothetical protein
MPIDDHGEGPGKVLLWIEGRFPGGFGIFLGLLWCFSIPILIVLALWILLA